MECEQFGMEEQIISEMSGLQPGMYAQNVPGLYGDVPMRSRTAGVPLPLRRSCVEGGVVSAELDLDARLNLSKSL